MSLFQRGRSRQDEARHRREVKGSHHVVMSLCHQVILSLCHHEAQEAGKSHRLFCSAVLQKQTYPIESSYKIMGTGGSHHVVMSLCHQVMRQRRETQVIEIIFVRFYRKKGQIGLEQTIRLFSREYCLLSFGGFEGL